MAKVEVTYTVTMKQTIDWPDDEMADLNYDNLHCNLNVNDVHQTTIGDIDQVKVNGEVYFF